LIRLFPLLNFGVLDFISCDLCDHCVMISVEMISVEGGTCCDGDEEQEVIYCLVVER
jgi:hypothetical protein